MTRISRANKISANSDGFTQGEIVAIQDAENSLYGEQLEWCVAVDTQKGTKTILRVWTGKTINEEKTYKETEETQAKYNKITQLCLNLAIVDESTLMSKKEIDIDLAKKLEGKLIEFKTKPSKKRRALKEIDISTVRLVKVSAK